jgi:uncharacterized membrane protein YgaE (UPF0421/DUF939 family)
MVQAAVAAAIAWGVAKALWGHSAPFFAPVSAIIALGQSYHQRGRRALELVFAVSLGIAIADLLAWQIGTGVPQLAFAVFVSMGLGLFFGSSQLFVNQVAISAALVFTILPPTNGPSFARTLDALTGGVVALVVAAVLLPADPLRMVRDAAGPLLDELADTIDDIAHALAARDPEAAEAALVRARGIDQLGAALTNAARESRETVRFSPARRRSLGTIEFYLALSERIDLAIRNVRVLARGAMRAVALADNVPPDVIAALEELAAAVRGFEGDVEAVREHALRASAIATQVLEGTTNLSVSVIVGQIRSTATDLLTGTGLSYEQATDAIRQV